jgi:riboflavin synthase
MFTGIIESEGTILELTKKGSDIALTISYDQKIFDDIHDGDSISVNGICLTIEQFSKDKLKFHLSMESISKVAKFSLDQKVNLERSLKLNDRISGHFVFGHVDGIAVIEDIEKLNDCEKWNIKVPSNLKKYIAKKGSISLNGVSLTVNSIENDLLSVNLIPFTLGHTTFQYNKIGRSLNLEIDMLARYVETINNNK